MSRAIEAVQLARSQAERPRVVDLLRLTTYTDRVAKTGATSFYFGSQACRFDWANAGTDREFWPVVLEVNALAMEISHLPGLGAGLLRREISISLANVTIKGQRLAALLENEAVSGAEIEWAQLLIDDDELVTPRLDLTGYAGSEGTYYFRGRVRRVGPISNERIDLQCETEALDFNWLRADDGTKTDPRDLGRRLPVVYGKAKKVPAINYDVGFVTTLAEEITGATTGTIKVTDTTGFASAGSGFIGTESIAWTGKSPTTLTGVTRGQDSTQATSHKVGDSIVETITTATFVVAGHAVSAINEIYLRNPATNDLVRLDPAEFSFTTNASDTVDGETMATVKFTAAELRAMLDALSVDITTPSEIVFGSFSDGFSGALNPLTGHVALNDPDSTVGSISAFGSVLNSSSTVGAEDGFGHYLPPGTFADTSRDVVRYRARIAYDRTSLPTSGQAWLRLQLKWVEQGGIGGGTVLQEDIEVIDSGSGTTLDSIHFTTWKTVTGRTLADFEETFTNSAPTSQSILYYASESISETGTASWTIKHATSGLEFELVPLSATLTGGAAVGFGLQLYADVDGYVAPAASPLYKAGTGTLMEAPADIMRHWIEVQMGDAIDTSTYDDCYTNLGTTAALWGFDARGLGLSALEVLERMGYEARANLVPEQVGSGVAWKMLTALSTFAFPATSGVIVDHEPGGFAQGDTDLRIEAATRFQSFYAYDASKGTSDAAFAKVLRADADSNDLTVPSVANFQAAEASLGVIVLPPIQLLCVQDDATAKDRLGYEAHERIREAATFALRGVPGREVYASEPGDLVDMTPPWSSTSRKVRLLRVEKDPVSELYEIRAVEVE